MAAKWTASLAQATAAALVVYGALVVFLPQLLPTTGTMAGGM